ncbi:MAG: 30S ribosomal protein S20 [Alphaproteobacteria bacterium]|nr:30S ribosomal protein S20 [Alphaproteobacteria bacterium]MBT5828370.1 30S ribosomal protein S20 [Alphaproteobacteria bacterium]
MANHKSAQKRIRQTERKTEVNRKRRSQIRTAIRAVMDAITAKKKDDATTALKKAESSIMKGVSKGVVKKETASRKVSRLVAAVKKIA